MPDDVIPYAMSATYYRYKTGIFSSERLFICGNNSLSTTGCKKIIKDLYGEDWYKGAFKPSLANGVKEYIDENIENGTFKKVIKQHHKELKDSIKEYQEEIANEAKRKESLIKSIIQLLNEKAVKMPASDIDAFLKHQDVDEIKELCEGMYHNGQISRTANYRYFILSEEKKKPKKSSAPKSEAVDVEKELEKLKGLLDKGLITQEQYDAKSNELLGL